MSRTLLRHLHMKIAVNQKKSPSTALLLQENSMIECRFDLFFLLILQMSPQLGEYARDLENYVMSLNILDGELVLDCCLRALRMSK